MSSEFFGADGPLKYGSKFSDGLLADGSRFSVAEPHCSRSPSALSNELFFSPEGRSGTGGAQRKDTKFLTSRIWLLSLDADPLEV